ncbi:MAG: YfhO family protein [Eubacteriales bacterium]|nr:YfhO family protein [Eubacteriales bacterium]
MSKTEKRKCFLIYTGLFLMMAAVVYHSFAAAGKTLVSVNDGFNQHYRALRYYGEWLRGIVHTLFTEGRLTFPEWDFSIGYGANILTTFHYYVIGDPLTLLAVFVPAKYTAYLYSFLIVLRAYLSGIAFLCYCIYMKKKNCVGILAGAFIYVFGSWTIIAGIRHPFFANPMIYLPFVLIGVEKIFRKEKPWVLIFSVFVSAASNFYFFYMIALQTVIYVLVRCCALFGRKRFREALGCIAKIGGCSLIGVFLSAPILFPVIRVFLSDNRSGVEHAVNLLYQENYYGSLLAAFTGPVSPGSWTNLSYGAAAFFAVLFLFAGKNRKKYTGGIKAMFLVGTLMLLTPAAGHILNGFSYVSNRWAWGYGMMIAYIVTMVWEDFVFFDGRGFVLKGRTGFVLLAALTAAYIDACGRFENMRGILRLMIVFLLLLAVGAFTKIKKSYLSLGMLAVVLLGTAWNSYCQNSPSRAEYFMSAKEVEARMQDNPDDLVRELQEDSGFFRYSGDAVQVNSSVNGKTRSTQFFWSLSQGAVADCFIGLNMNVHRLYYYSGLDRRAGAGALAGVKYYISPYRKASVPWGFRFLTESGKYFVYENEYALPLGYTYMSCITEEDLAGLNGVQKEEAMLQSVLLEEMPEGLEKGEPVHGGEKLDCQIVRQEGKVAVDENAFVVSKRDASVTLEIAGDSAGPGEYYVHIAGLDYEGTKDELGITITFSVSGQTRSRRFLHSTAKANWSSGIHDHMVNLGYTEENPTAITITFPARGRYTFDEISIWRQPVDSYGGYIAARKADAWENEVIGTDTVKGCVDVSENKILCLSIPYDGGWSAYVDGKKQKILKANYMFSAVPLEAGRHEILLVYRTPGLGVGLALCICGIIAMAGIVLAPGFIAPSARKRRRAAPGRLKTPADQPPER